MMNLGLIVPCRNEAGVIARKLRNLAQLDWPEANEVHRVIVVDDNSEDATARIAREEIEALDFPLAVRIEVVVNDVQPGKPGAVRAGLSKLAGTVDCCGLSDADVLLDSAAVRAALEAVGREPELAMVCGAQRFVEVLPDEVGGDALVSTADAYDRVTAWWRLVESKFGALFSVHGQFLVWRAKLSIAPQLGLAADDLDLMLQVRNARPRGATRLLPTAIFYERKARSGVAAEGQALRRARAYVQVVRSHSLPPNQSIGRKLQWLAYRRLPLASPSATLAAMVAVPTLATWTWGVLGLGTSALLVALLVSTTPGRTWMRTMRIIWRAVRLESHETLRERWEMERA